MKKSIFSRYFYLGTIITFFFAALLGSLVLLWADGRYEDEKREQAANMAHLMITETRENYSRYGNVDTPQIHSQFSYYALTYNVSCYLFDENGACLLRSDYADGSIRLSDSLMNSVQRKPTFQVNQFTGLIQELSVCYIEHFQLYDTDQEHGAYLALVYPAEQLTGFSKELFFVLVIGLMAVTVLAAIVFYFNTRHMLKPVKEITKAAERYADGDFSFKPDVADAGELTYLAMTMGRMADFIDSNEKNRKSFVSNVSHELRTPMTTISGFVDGILDGTIPPEQQQGYLRRISGEVKRLSRLVSSMLNISKFEEGGMELKLVPVELTGLLISTLFMFEQKIEARQIQVCGLEDCPRAEVQVDKDLMQQVFYNLIENAVKFTPRNGELTFSVMPQGEQCQVVIRNTGEGLSEEELSNVFNRFYKTDESRSKDTTGVGLGLSIVSRIIRLHNGNIMVKSVKGDYTEFVITLPVKGKKQLPPKERKD